MRTWRWGVTGREEGTDLRNRLKPMKLLFCKKKPVLTLGHFYMAHLNIKKVNELDGTLSLTWR